MPLKIFELIGMLTVFIAAIAGCWQFYKWMTQSTNNEEDVASEAELTEARDLVTKLIVNVTIIGQLLGRQLPNQETVNLLNEARECLSSAESWKITKSKEAITECLASARDGLSKIDAIKQIAGITDETLKAHQQLTLNSSVSSATTTNEASQLTGNSHRIME